MKCWTCETEHTSLMLGLDGRPRCRGCRQKLELLMQQGYQGCRAQGQSDLALQAAANQNQNRISDRALGNQVLSGERLMQQAGRYVLEPMVEVERLQVTIDQQRRRCLTLADDLGRLTDENRDLKVELADALRKIARLERKR